MPDQARCDHCAQPIESGDGWSFFSSSAVDISGQKQLMGNMLLCRSCTDHIITWENWRSVGDCQAELPATEHLTDPRTLRQKLQRANEQSIVQNCLARGLTPEQAKAKGREWAIGWWRDPDKASAAAAVYWTTMPAPAEPALPGPSGPPPDRNAQAVQRLTAVGGDVRKYPMPNGRTRSLVDLSKAKASDGDMAALADLEGLFAVLGVGCGQITDDGIRHLALLPDLRLLSVDNTRQRLTERSLLHVPPGALTSLGLVFGNSAIGAHRVLVADMATSWIKVASSHFPNLEDLTLGGGELADEALADLSALASLRRLSLINCGITSAGLRHLGNLKCLRQLELQSTYIAGLSMGKRKATGDGFEHLSHLADLHYLRLSDTSIGNSALPGIARLDRLRFLDLSNNAITQEGIEQLLPLRNLRYLGLENTKVIGPGLVERFLITIGIRKKRGLQRLQQQVPALTVVTHGAKDTLLSAFREWMETCRGSNGSPN